MNIVNSARMALWSVVAMFSMMLSAQALTITWSVEDEGGNSVFGLSIYNDDPVSLFNLPITQPTTGPTIQWRSLLGPWRDVASIVTVAGVDYPVNTRNLGAAPNSTADYRLRGLNPDGTVAALPLWTDQLNWVPPSQRIAVRQTLDNIQVSAVPLPAAGWLLLFGAGGLIGWPKLRLLVAAVRRLLTFGPPGTVAAA